MVKHLVFFLFFTGFVSSVWSETHKYLLVQQGKTWTNARIYCRTSHTDLAIIKSNDDLIRLQNEVQTQNFASTAWIGLYSDINGWKWSLNNELMGSLKPWDVGEPNNNGGRQSCGAATPWGWWDLSCSELHSFICFDETKNGSDRYIYISSAKTWSGAQTYCRQYHTDLSSARDAEENSVLLAKISGVTWFGLIKDSWKWVDNSTFSIMSWSSGQPDNSGFSCGGFSNSKASDESCKSLLPFFCFAEHRKQQMVQMKIQFGQDLNKPEVNTAILEKILQKLKDHGMEKDMRVKWRVKKDGVIFNKKKLN